MAEGSRVNDADHPGLHQLLLVLALQRIAPGTEQADLSYGQSPLSSGLAFKTACL